MARLIWEQLEEDRDHSTPAGRQVGCLICLSVLFGEVALGWWLLS